jgi:hypothetical protein
MHKTLLRSKIARLRGAGVRRGGCEPARTQPHVHFHQGPQGQPVPCYDERCPNPRLSI